MSKKIAICGVHGTGKSKICEKINNACYDKYGECKFSRELAYIPEQFREVVKDTPNFTKQTQEITLATYAKQLYLENLYTAQGKNILCDRSVLDTFVYYNYFNKEQFMIYPSFDDNVGVGDESGLVAGYNEGYSRPLVYAMDQAFFYTAYKYDKIYLIEPSGRPIANDGFRLTDKSQQLEIHKLFLEYFKDFSNVEIINQEEQDKIVEMVVNDFNI